MASEIGQASLDQAENNEDRPRVKRYRREDLDQEEKLDVLEASGDDE